MYVLFTVSYLWYVFYLQCAFSDMCSIYSVLSLIQPLVILLSYASFTYLTQSDHPQEDLNDHVVERINLLEDRLQQYEGRTLSSQFVGDLSETITHVENEIEVIVKTLEDLTGAGTKANHGNRNKL